MVWDLPCLGVDGTQSGHYNGLVMADLDNRNEQVTNKPGIFSSLRFPDYRRLWIAAACSQSAGWALIVMRAALVYQLTSSSAWVGIVTAAALLPGLVVTPMAGLLADRFDRRKVLSAVYVLNLGHNILLAFLVLAGAMDQYLLLVLAIFNGSIRAIQMPTTQALLPNLVPPDRLLNAVALNQLMQQSSRMWGPLMMLPFILWVGPEPAFFVCAGLYALALTQLLTIRTVSRGEVQASSGVFTNLVAGVKYIYTTRLLMFIMLLTLGHCALTMAFESVFPYFSRAELGFVTDDKLFLGPTYLMIGVGSGAILGNLLLARVEGQKFRGRLLLGLGVLSGLTPMLLGLSFNLPTAMLAAAAMGASTAAFMTLSHGLVQAITPDGVRGRVMGANTWHVQGIMAAFNPINGLLMDQPWMTAPILLSAMGLAFVWVMAASTLAPPLRSIYLQGMPARAVAAH